MSLTILAAEMPPEATLWVVGLMVAGVLTVFGFLLRNAFTDLKEGVAGLNNKLDAMKEAQGAKDIRIALLERDVAELKGQMKELSEGAQ